MPNAETVLIVDDDKIFCHVLSGALKKRGYHVELAYSLAQSIEEAKKHVPQLAVVDLRIGADSGLNVIRALIECDSSIRIVVLTGFASISTAVESIKLGAIHYLTKPAVVDDIIKAFYHDVGDSQAHLESKPMSTKRIEWEHMQKVLNDHRGNISAAARAMGMHRRTLQRKLQKKPVQN